MSTAWDLSDDLDLDVLVGGKATPAAKEPKSDAEVVARLGQEVAAVGKSYWYGYLGRLVGPLGAGVAPEVGKQVHVTVAAKPVGKGKARALSVEADGTIHNVPLSGDGKALIDALVGTAKAWTCGVPKEYEVVATVAKVTKTRSKPPKTKVELTPSAVYAPGLGVAFLVDGGAVVPGVSAAEARLAQLKAGAKTDDAPVEAAGAAVAGAAAAAATAAATAAGAAAATAAGAAAATAAAATRAL